MDATTEKVHRPLDGVRILAVEQMAALPFATQLMARLGADVVKIEHPSIGESGRGSLPAISDPDGRSVGATFLRNNLNKRSVGIDLKQPEGVELVLRMACNFDVFGENFRAGTADRLGIGYDAIYTVHPAVVYLSVSGFGQDPASPYRDMGAYASVVEAMSGIYEFKRAPGRAPIANPVGALGDISSALFGTVGVLAALRQRDQTGVGQHIDVAMLDATVAMTDIVANFYSMGVEQEWGSGVGIVDTFAASDGYFVLQCVREHHFAILCAEIGHPELVDDQRLATRAGWQDHLEGLLRPTIERWSASRTTGEVVSVLSAAGLACGPSLTPAQVVSDPHLALRNMLIETTPGDAEAPVLVPGNPVKLSRVPQVDDNRVPWLGEHTEDVLAVELGLDSDELAKLRSRGVIGPA
ncbi:MAG: CaiB/BaiF CoA-transferase family protein [Acidimicrobiales bacterium]|nr:CaiB/BaiF CoA-transferase family protein [Acidimicrobiales bacterium]